MASLDTNTRAQRANSRGEERAARPGRSLKPFPIGEGFLVVGGFVLLGFIATLAVYGLQLAGVLS